MISRETVCTRALFGYWRMIKFGGGVAGGGARDLFERKEINLPRVGLLAACFLEREKKQERSTLFGGGGGEMMVISEAMIMR